MVHIATFYSHFGAIRFKKICDSKQWPAKIMPVPRSLSSSCGTCVQFEGEALCPAEAIPDEVEQIVEVTDTGYVSLYRAKDS